MQIHPQHRWNVSPDEAIQIQESLRHRIDLTTALPPIQTVAGVDIAYAKHSDELFAAVVVLEIVHLAVLEIQSVQRQACFPYIPGLFSFRELPAILDCFSQLHTIPDLVICDGQGIAHPRRFGLACHLGLFLERPCLGCAKTRLIGTYEEPAARAGSFSTLRIDQLPVGIVLRSKTSTRPLFVSPGHRIRFDDLAKVVLPLCRQTRLPETTRQANHYVNQLRHRWQLGLG